MSGVWRLDASHMVSRMGQIDTLLDAKTRVAGADIARKTKEHTTPLVPLRRGWLERSWRDRMVSGTPLKWEMLYSAKSRQGYDYSARQHEEKFRHPIRGTDHYLLKGFERETRPVEVWSSHIMQVL